MDYMETIKYIMNNIIDQKEIYANISSKTRIHVYREKCGDINWYNVVGEVIYNGNYMRESKMSASDTKELRRIIGVTWMILEDYTRRIIE